MPATQDTDWIEVYAGQANCTKCIRYANYRGVKFDLLYSRFLKEGNKNKSDYMNILDPSGFLFLGQISMVNIQNMPHLKLGPPQLWSFALRLVCIFVLKGRSCKGFVVMVATKCSTMVHVNSGTSGRSPCAAIGNTWHRSVSQGNRMAERTVFELKARHVILISWGWFCTFLGSILSSLRSALLCLLTTCKGGTWVSEQANSSVLEYYPPWRYMLNCHIQNSGLAAVTQFIWFFTCNSLFIMPNSLQESHIHTLPYSRICFFGVCAAQGDPDLLVDGII